MLLELKKYIQEQGDANLYEMCLNFDVDAETMRKMLEQLINKGVIRKKQSAEVVCAKCPQCHLLANEIYEWIEKEDSHSA